MSWINIFYMYLIHLSLDIPALFYLQEMEQMDLIAYFLCVPCNLYFYVSLVIHVDPLCGQYTINLDPQTYLTLGIRADQVILKPFNQI